MSETPAKRTPLHDRHVAHGARMVSFAGWDMPVQYSGLIDEHMAVRKRAGLFDVSHMGEARVRGAQACDFLQYLTCNNVATLKIGRAHARAGFNKVATERPRLDYCYGAGTAPSCCISPSMSA